MYTKLHKRFSVIYSRRNNLTAKDKWVLACVSCILLIIFIFYCMRGSSFHLHKQLPHLNLHGAHLMNKHEIDDIEAMYVNLPLRYWLQVRKDTVPYRKNSTCATMPNLLELDNTHVVWQTARFADATIQLLNAYYDPRDVTTGTNVRIISMIDRNETLFSMYCQMWFEDETEPIIEKVQKTHYMWFAFWHMHSNGQYGPWLIECKIPESHTGRVPIALSIVEKPCDTASNLLRVQYESYPEKKNFTVCIKGLNFPQVDLSVRIIEWLELLFLMGADKVHIYDLEMHPNMRKVMNYYEKEGKVDLRFLALTQGQINLPYLQHMYIQTHGLDQILQEIIPYNDCFYRNINKYKYVIILDIDEIIIPQKDDDWSGLIHRIQNQSKPDDIFSSYNARNVYFMDDMMPEGTYPDVPPYMHMLQHVYRCFNFTPPGCYVKTFYSTDYVISCHNHWPIDTIPAASGYEITTDEAHMQHYRKDCVGELDCNLYRNHIVKDANIWRYKDTLIRNTNKVLEELRFLE